MLIDEGYWNYYLTFRIENYEKHLIEIEKKKEFSGIIAFVAGENVLVNKEVEDLLEDRKRQMRECLSTLQEDETIEKLHELYKSDSLPEYYFDFDRELQDLLDKQIEESISQVRFISHAYGQVLHTFGEGKTSYYALMPLKMYLTEWEFVYCRVYIQLLRNGIGVIKLEVPLKSVLAEDVSNYPMKRWFSYIKVWDALFSVDGDRRYKIVAGETEGVQDITQILINYVKNIFSESIVDQDRFTGFETFIISKSSNCDIINTSKSNEKSLRQIYHFAFPEDFALEPCKEELRQFWDSAHFNASGVHVIKGDCGRLVMYADVSQLLQRNERGNVEDRNDYLQASVTGTFEPFLVLALAQKDNEISIYRIAEKDNHIINKSMVQYYGNANYLEGMLMDAPKHGVHFYREVRKMLDDYPVDFRKMLDRMQRIEEYEKLNLNEKQNNLLNRFTLLFTVLFGLPLIQDTLNILKLACGIQYDFIPAITVSQVSFVLWLIILFCLITDNISEYLEYEGIQIEGRKSFKFRIKSLLLVVLGWLFKMKRK